MPSVMITGASRGIGLEFVRAHAADGYQVYATCHNISNADRLKALRSNGRGNIEIIEHCEHRCVASSIVHVDQRGWAVKGMKSHVTNLMGRVKVMCEFVSGCNQCT